MIYFAYKEDGEFNGFYNTDVHEDIPKESIEITEELQKELLTGLWIIDINKIENIEAPLDVKDKSLFTEKEITVEPFVPFENAVAKQLAQSKIDNMKKDTIINSLARQVALNKINIMNISKRGSELHE